MAQKTQFKNDSHSFLDEEERRCCEEKEVPEDGQPHDCIDTWKAKRTIAENALKVASAKAGKATVAYENSSAWEWKLQAWIENAKSAHKLAVSVFIEINRFLAVVTHMEASTARTIEAIETVLCLVKKIFDDVEKLLRTSTSAEDPKGALQTLKLHIECHEKLDERKKQEALACIAPYEAKIQAIYTLQENLVKKLLEILKVANVVAAAVSSPEGKKNFALKWQLEDLRRRIIGEANSKAKYDECTCSGQNQNQDPNDPPCGKEITKPAVRLLPIRAMDKLPDSAYYAGLKKLYDDATNATKAYNAKMNEAKRESEKAAMRYASLNEAIIAAEAAESQK